MGLGLSHPVSSKILLRLGNKRFRVGAATMHGWRETMEDAHTVEPEMPNHKESGFFGIFDGHSGSLCSTYVAKNLFNNIDGMEDLTNREKMSDIVMKTDQDFLDSPEFKNKDDGSAGIFTIATYNPITGEYHLINGNVGDSRTVLARHTENGYIAVTCTEDHKPNDEKERRRIEQAGGTVQLSRVDGQLALSRAFGDRMLKHPIHLPANQRKVISLPDFTEEKATKDDFLFMACDGIYEGDYFTRESVISWIAEKLKETNDIAHICALVLDECLARGSRDNMSAMIIQFVDGTDYNQKADYRPGPYFSDDGDSKFQEAYANDARAAGFSLEQALDMIDSRKKENEKNDENKSF